MNFDEWKENPYTKVLETSIATDYVPRTDLVSANERIMELEAKLARQAELTLEAANISASNLLEWMSSSKQLTAEREVSDKLEKALKYIMEWQVGNVDKWHNRAYDSASATLTEVAAIRKGEPT